jgi:hypothetical protein
MIFKDIQLNTHGHLIASSNVYTGMSDTTLGVRKHVFTKTSELLLVIRYVSSDMKYIFYPPFKRVKDLIYLLSARTSSSTTISI